tara:strand:+ start:1515 stop:1709 length:195 start_codon:yes stop_codon:yes gene_type:complete
MFGPFDSYEEIPASQANYILSVSDADNIADIPLDDINGFLAGLEAWYIDEQNRAQSVCHNLVGR